MIDRESVVKGLEKCRRYECDDCTEKGASQAPWDCPAYDDFVNSAISLLKEQESKTPIVRENSYGWKFYYCPRCEKEFYQNRKQDFCDKCGQEVKWE